MTDAAFISQKPYLREHIVSFSPLLGGRTFRFKIKSLNEIGEAESVIDSQILAAIPDAPITAPVSDAAITSINAIKVRWQQVTNENNSEILSYSLEIDDGEGGDFIVVVGLV